MTYDVVLSSAAIADIADAIEWYEKHREGLGFEFQLSLEAGVSFLERNPLLCQKRYKSVRVKYINRFPFGIHYELVGMTVKIIAVFHMKRSLLRWTDRI